MRHEVQQRDKIHVKVEIVQSGAGQTGLTPTAVLKRVSDGLFWDASGGSFGATAVSNPMTEVDATDLPGYYRLDVPEADLDMILGEEGYEFSVTEGTNSVYELGVIETVDEVSTYPVTGELVVEPTMSSGHQYVQLGTTAYVNLALSATESGKGGGFSVDSAVLKTEDGTVSAISVSGDAFVELGRPVDPVAEAAVTATPTFSSGGGPSGEDVWVVTVDDTSPFSTGDHVRGKDKPLGQGHIHEVLAVPSGTVVHLHATSTAFDIIDGDTVEKVTALGVYSGSVLLDVGTYFGVDNQSGDLEVTVSTLDTGNGPVFDSEVDVTWVRSLELDLSGRGFRVG